MEQVTILNDVPGNAAWKSAVDEELRRVLDPFTGPWTVRLRPVEAWQGGNGWSVEVTRPGHVWTLRITEHNQEPEVLAHYVNEAVQPDRFARKDGDGG
ncbi:MAG TPA: hypothetical protein VFO85_09785, partial [Vicinamibacteria bacterium]|nr:hypothetical protein [Vicinamibacteria bacterium]